MVAKLQTPYFSLSILHSPENTDAVSLSSRAISPASFYVISLGVVPWRVALRWLSGSLSAQVLQHFLPSADRRHACFSNICYASSTPSLIPDSTENRISLTRLWAYMLNTNRHTIGFCPIKLSEFVLWQEIHVAWSPLPCY